MFLKLKKIRFGFLFNSFSRSKSKFAVLGALAKKIYEKSKSRPKSNSYYGSGGGGGGSSSVIGGGMYHYNRPNYYNEKNNNIGGVYNEHHNYNDGIYEEYTYRPNEYASIVGETCINNLEFEGIVLGKFICPIEGKKCLFFD